MPIASSRTPRALALALALALAAGAARAATPAGDILLTTPLYTAAEVDALLPAPRTWYATSATAAATAAKVASTVTGDFVLTNGACVLVKFTAANNVVTPTLNVDGKGAKTIRKFGTTSSLAYEWQAGEVVPFVYDGTQFQIVKGGWATTTYYGATRLSSATNSTSAALAATPAAVKLVRDEVGRLAASIPGAPVWDTATLGANPTVALAVAANTAYQRTGTGTLTLSAVTGLCSEPTYCIFSGFTSLVLPSGFAVAGSGAFRAGKENHLALWSTPSGNFVNFLFAQ